MNVDDLSAGPLTPSLPTAKQHRVAPPRIDTDSLPPLREDPSFLGMTATQFLGAFNDNLFKQLMLLLSLKVVGPGSSADRDVRLFRPVRAVFRLRRVPGRSLQQAD